MSYEYTTEGFTVNNAGRRIVVDPITRIEGHLRCEVNIDENNVITNAVSCGTMFRGIEIVLKDRDPREAWAFAERICGVCTGTHALASVNAVESALGITVPDNASIIRNLLELCLWYHDHLVHFFQLTGMDWIDVASAATADPKKTSELAQSLSSWPLSSPGYFSDLAKKLRSILDSGNQTIFRNGYWGNPSYQFPPEANLMLMSHYFQALDFQRLVVQIHTVFGGKNPHPNWLVGGVPCSLNLDQTGGSDVINEERLSLVQKRIKECLDFATHVVVPDSLALASFYKNWCFIGSGLSKRSFISYGGFPQYANDFSDKSLLIPRGAIINGNFNEVLPVDLWDPEQVQEVVEHSWYEYPAGAVSLHPFEGVTDPHFVLGKNTVGTNTDIKQLDETAKYSWIKTPRWRGHMMEVGPLSRTMIAYYSKKPEAVEIVNGICAKVGIPVEGMHSTVGRIVARCHEVLWTARTMQFFFDKLIANIKNGDVSTANTTMWDPDTWPAYGRGIGFNEAPRGSLGHWVTIRDKKIERYQCVVPTTWNAAPRSQTGQLGPYEAALMGTRMAVPEQPLEIIRTIHSFDPCLACATHIIGANGEDLATVQVV